MGVPAHRAEAMKQQIGLSDTSAEMSAQAAGRVIESSASAFVDEIRGSLDYYTASSGSARISRLLLTGGGSRLTGLAERLQAATRIEVSRPNPLDSMTIGRTGLTAEQIQFVEPLAVVPVGLALGAVA